MERRKFNFFLVQYVPDPIRTEFINIGIILSEIGIGNPAIVRFTRDWSRVLCLDPEADTDLLEAIEKDIASKFDKGGEVAHAILESLQEEFSNSLQISEARMTMISDLEEGAGQLLQMYVERRK